MGRITVFAINECPFCVKAKGALKERDIPYTEINLSIYPDKRADMLSITDSLTVPQVFFNEEHIGGSEATLALLDQWDKDTTLYSTPLLRYQAEIESKPDPTDPRLAFPTTAPIIEKPPPPRNDSDKLQLPNGDIVTILQITQKLMEEMPKADLIYHAVTYKNCFKGSTGTLALKKLFHLPTEEDAICFGRTLQTRKILHHVTYDHEFDNNSKFYRLQPYQNTRQLNSYRVWTDRVDPDSHGILRRLSKLMGGIRSRATNAADGKVDLIAAASDQKYDQFQEEICELQKVFLDIMNPDARKAFIINVYNLMIHHAQIQLGVPQKNLQRACFFISVKYNIGGELFSFNDLENGILRGNSPPPYGIKNTFGGGDKRNRLVLDVDCRIHFGLNCGAASCPPIKKFTPQAVDEELRIVAQAFCEQDANVEINEEKNELHLSMIFNWYRADFADSVSKLPDTIVKFLRGERKARLERMMEKKIKIKFMTYDWSGDASNSKVYQKTAIKVAQNSILAFFT